jgi:hypothetical protein
MEGAFKEGAFTARKAITCTASCIQSASRKVYQTARQMALFGIFSCNAFGISELFITLHNLLTTTK